MGFSHNPCKEISLPEGFSTAYPISMKIVATTVPTSAVPVMPMSPPLSWPVEHTELTVDIPLTKEEIISNEMFNEIKI